MHIWIGVSLISNSCSFSIELEAQSAHLADIPFAGSVQRSLLSFVILSTALQILPPHLVSITNKGKGCTWDRQRQRKDIEHNKKARQDANTYSHLRPSPSFLSCFFSLSRLTFVRWIHGNLADTCITPETFHILLWNSRNWTFSLSNLYAGK